MKLRIPTIAFFLFLFSLAGLGEDRYIMDSLKTAISNEESDTVKIRLLNELAGQYSRINRDSSIILLNKALVLARVNDVPDQKAWTYANLGNTWCFMGEYLKALEFLDLAYNIAFEHGYKHRLAYIHYIKSIVFLSIDNLKKANEHANQALEMYKSLGNMQRVSSVYTVIAMIFEGLDDHQKSLDFKQKAYQIKLQLNDTAGIAMSLNNLSLAYSQMGQPDTAYMYLRKAIVLNKKYGTLDWLSINYGNLADLFVETGELDSADYYNELAIKLSREIDYMLAWHSMLETKADIALMRKDTSVAIDIFQMIINSPKEIDQLKAKTTAYRKMYEIAYAQKSYQSAVEYHKSYKYFDDSLKKEKNTSLLILLEMQMKYEKQHSQLELENKEVKLTSQRKNFYLFMMAGIILLLGISIYFVYKLQKARARAIKIEKQRIEEELEFKNREMTANVMSLMKKNEILGDISKELLEIEKNAVKSETKLAMRKIAQRIRKSRDVELWEEFDKRFKQVHNKFYNDLIKQFPNLSPSEHRLCAFLKMNMSTKDISELTGTSPRSVDTARYRVRKKLGLAGDDNLVGFLSKL